MSSNVILRMLAGGALFSGVFGIAYLIYRKLKPLPAASPIPTRSDRASWRMPPLALLGAPKLSIETRLGLLVLRTYLLIAMILVVVRLVQMALGH
jgi:hypothetical protein